MKVRSYTVTTVGLFWLVFPISPVAAQRVRPPQLGVTVQLPVLRNFSVQTAVMVPDGGTMSLGGVTRSASGRRSSGVPGVAGPLSRPFRNSATGRSTGVARATVTTRILSARELEEQITGARSDQPESYRKLANNADGKPKGDVIVEVDPEINQWANYLTQHVGRRVR